MKRYAVYPAFAMQANWRDIQDLAADPGVLRIIEDQIHPPTLAESLPLIGADAEGTFAGSTGHGQVVAILDTGVDKNHPFLTGKVVSEACYSSNVAADHAPSLCPGGETADTAGGNDKCGPHIIRPLTSAGRSRAQPDPGAWGTRPWWARI